MFVENIITEFYNKLFGEQCVVFVNHDVDAICACKILQSLFRCDDIVYTIVPVTSMSDVVNSYRENLEVKSFIFLNCGATCDIIEELAVDNEQQLFFVIDSHRPLDVCNVYNNKQIYVISAGAQHEDIPSFDDIFQDESEDENDDDDDETDSNDENSEHESRLAKRQRLNHERAIKRREKRVWEERRDKLMFEYTQFSFYGRSTAVQLYELAWKLSKDSIDLLWWAIVGLMEQSLLNKIESEQYAIECSNLQNHVTRLNRLHSSKSSGPVGLSSTSSQSPVDLKIVYENDLRLALYRHWTVESSLKYSMYTACQLRLWTIRGEKRLHELLAEMGLPLMESRQNFNSMDLVLRKEFQPSLEKLAERYTVDDIVYGSFALHFGYKSKYSSSDVVYAMLALLETQTGDKDVDSGFLHSLDCLSRGKKDVLETGINQAKKMLIAVSKQVQAALGTGQILSAGSFLYLIIKEGTLDACFFSRPHILLMLAQFSLRAYVAVSKSKKAIGKPLICSAPHHTEKEFCLMLGTPPLSEDSPKNFFGKAFSQAALNCRAEIIMSYFDSSVIIVNVKDRGPILDALTALLS